MDNITNNILNNLNKNRLQSSKGSTSDASSTPIVIESEVSSNVIKINETKNLVSELAFSAPIDSSKVSEIKAAISSGNYPLDLDKISDALMQAYREMKS
ncbi:MAG: flagellar biosynthesis anti-sigma factor FlgM [Candidatus Puniceispirillales bacterium]|jgi:negative regulator of flagellin synthesis FlgM|tara:strand:- start:2926 stop:3222 length:297 start_codon:yes stop_codon:yes gene_type:complete